MQQIDNLNELPKDKRPTDDLIWNGSSEELDDWLDRVLSRKEQKEFVFNIKEDEIEE